MAKDTIIEGGGFLTGAREITVDATSIVDNVTFERPGGKGAGVALADPLSIKGSSRASRSMTIFSLGALRLATM